MRNFCLFAAAVCFSCAATALPDPTLNWKLETKVNLGSCPIAFPTARPDSAVMGMGGEVLRIAGDGRLLWHATFGPEAGRGGPWDPAAADLDGDGVEEVVSGHKVGRIVALDAGSGALRWEYDLGGEMDSWGMSRCADLDNDGAAEILVGLRNGWVYCLNGDGTLRWRSRMENYLASTPSVGDLNGDGSPEIVYGTATRHLIALHADGTLLWDAFLPPHHLGRTAPLIADLDQDGKAEIYSLSSMIGEDGVVALNGADGSLRWKGETRSKSYNARSVVRFDDGTLGLLAGDKGNFLAAYQPDGAKRWHVQVNGRGIWTPPTVADLDGDGKLEILFTVRDQSNDGKHNSFYVLTTQGETLGAYDMGPGFGAPLVADVDGDGKLEVVVNDKNGVVSAYTFGGREGEKAAVGTGWINEKIPTTQSAAEIEKAIPPPLELLSNLMGTGITPEGFAKFHGYGFGGPAMPIAVPQGMQAEWFQLVTVTPEGVSEIQRYPSKALMIQLPVTTPGAYRYRVQLLDKSGKALGEQSLHMRARNPARFLAQGIERLIDVIEDSAEALSMEAELLLRTRGMQLRASLRSAEEEMNRAEELTLPERDRLVSRVEDLLEQAQDDCALHNLLLANMRASESHGFAVWADKNPWDNLRPQHWDTLPDAVPMENLKVWAFGNEIESTCINVMNITDHPLTLRLEPGTVLVPGADKPVPAKDHAKWMRVAWLPSKLVPSVADILPKFENGYLIDIAPGEVRQLWLNLNSRGLAPGTYQYEWPLRTFDQASDTQKIQVSLEVSPVSLPEKSRYLLNVWSRHEIGGLSTTADLSEHLQTVWTGPPVPAMKADAKGRIIEEGDWSIHDGVLREAKQVELVLYGWVPVPQFPQGVEVTPELQLTGQRNGIEVLLRHLAQFGLGYQNIMFYVEDEPGLTGTITHYMERARALKVIDPRLQAYANPWETVSVERIEEMWPVTDVWQPGMETIEYLGPDYVAAMKKGGKRVMTYTPPGEARTLKPLDFYRAQAWQAFHWGITGGGYWVYYGNEDFWATRPDQEPNYGVVAFDGREIVTTRRWEATRDGIEDFNALTMLREQAEAKQDQAALAVLKAAVDYVAGITITGMPIGAGESEIKYAAFQHHRQEIREALERLQQ